MLPLTEFQPIPGVQLAKRSAIVNNSIAAEE